MTNAQVHAAFLGNTRLLSLVPLTCDNSMGALRFYRRREHTIPRGHYQEIPFRSPYPSLFRSYMGTCADGRFNVPAMTIRLAISNTLTTLTLRGSLAQYTR